MKYASKPVPEGAKFRNAPLLAAGIGILRVCHLPVGSLIYSLLFMILGSSAKEAIL